VLALCRQRAKSLSALTIAQHSVQLSDGSSEEDIPSNREVMASQMTNSLMGVTLQEA